MSPVPTLSVTVEPIGDRVVVVPLEAEQTTASGIVIPDTAKGEKPAQGTVLALGKGGVGADCPDPSTILAVGDRVLFQRYAGDEIKLKDDQGKDVSVRVFRLESVLAKLS